MQCSCLAGGGQPPLRGTYCQRHVRTFPLFCNGASTNVPPTLEGRLGFHDTSLDSPETPANTSSVSYGYMQREIVRYAANIFPAVGQITVVSCLEMIEVCIGVRFQISSYAFESKLDSRETGPPRKKTPTGHCTLAAYRAGSAYYSEAWRNFPPPANLLWGCARSQP